MKVFPSDGDREGAGSALASSALQLAAEGSPVVPLLPKGKRPLPGFGLSKASTDLGLVAAWWERWPAANVGMRADGLCVLDIDGAIGERSLRDLADVFGPLPATRVSRTGKGRHLFFAAATVGNSTRGLGRPEGVHVRGGAHGYVVAPPSVHTSGRRYEWIDERLPAPLPESWREPLERSEREPVTMATAAGVGLYRTSTAYGHAALASESDRLLRACRGERNDCLNESVFRLAQLVAGGELALGDLEATALAVAAFMGLGRDETRRTLRSALTVGLRFPRSAGAPAGWRKP